VVNGALGARPEAGDGRRAPRLVAAAACALLGVTVALWLRSHATNALDDDGPGLVWLFALAGDSHPGWHHAAYAYAVALVRRVFDEPANGALLWTSALGAGAGAAVFALLLARQRVGPSALAIGVAGLLVSPGFVSNGTRVEVHGTQVLGCALLLVALAPRPRAPVAGDGPRLALGAFAAATLHSSSLLLLPGCALLVWARAAGGERVRRAAPGLVGLVAGGLAALGANAFEASRGLARTHGNPVDLLAIFAGDASIGAFVDEVVEPWSAAWVAVAALVVLLRPRPAAYAPWLVAAAAPVVLLGPTGIDSDGGYYAGSVLFAAFGAVAASPRSAASSRPAAPPWRRVAAVALALLGAWHGARNSEALVHSTARAEAAAYRADRFALASAALPDGGAFVQVEAVYQPISGLAPDLFEILLYVDVVQGAERGLDADTVFERATQELDLHAAAGRTLALWTGWRAFAPEATPTGALLVDFERRATERFALEPVVVAGQPFLRGPARR